MVEIVKHLVLLVSIAFSFYHVIPEADRERDVARVALAVVAVAVVVVGASAVATYGSRYSSSYREGTRVVIDCSPERYGPVDVWISGIKYRIYCSRDGELFMVDCNDSVISPTKMELSAIEFVRSCRHELTGLHPS